MKKNKNNQLSHVKSSKNVNKVWKKEDFSDTQNDGNNNRYLEHNKEKLLRRTLCKIKSSYSNDFHTSILIIFSFLGVNVLYSVLDKY